MNRTRVTVSWLAAVIAIGGRPIEEDDKFVSEYLRTQLENSAIKKTDLAAWLGINRVTLDARLKGESAFTFVQVVQIMTLLEIGYISKAGDDAS